MARNNPLGAHSPLVNMDILEVLEEEGVDPIRVLAQVANGQISADPILRMQAAKELAQYVHPKKKALDLRASGKLAVTYNVVNFSEVMPDQAAQLKEQTQALLDSRPRTKAEVKQLVRTTPVNSAVLIEAMRNDVEGLVVDETGIVVDE
ncbi:MAG TPA: hypothetical protein PKD38_07465 [Nitrospira sp.]|nr:hypothetical protein [Nitrospira sp.]